LDTLNLLDKLTDQIKLNQKINYIKKLTHHYYLMIMKKFNYLLLINICIAITTGLNAQNWTQIGADIDGEAEGDNFGHSISLSSDGSIVAIGAPYISSYTPNAGYARIYKNKDGVWTQIGTDIDGEAEKDYSGESVSLSSDGSIVAIGASRNGGTVLDAGLVRIYENKNETWTQIGDDIDGEEMFDNLGSSVSLSSDGSIVAIGAYGASYVRIYENQSGVWTQIGTDINGETGGDQSGSSVCLSSDGSIVAIGAPTNSGTATYAGHVRIYENQSGIWTQIGADIDGEAENDYSGQSVSLSSDGSVVAIGASHNNGNGFLSGHVRIYENQSGTWTQIGADIDGEAAYDYSGQSVSLNSDGSIVAIGAPSYAGQSRVYKNQNGTWTKMGSDIDGEAESNSFGRSISLSSDGSVVAIGAEFNTNHSGRFGVYELLQLPTVSNQPLNQTNICIGSNVSITLTGNYMDSYQWQVDKGSGFTDITNGDVYSNATTATLNISDVMLSMNNYQYCCILTNADGSITSDTVSLTIDSEDPVITCVENQTVTADQNQTYTIVGTEFDPIETSDNCQITNIINSINGTETLSGETLSKGETHTITWTVTDMAGNAETCSFDVIVNTFVGVETILPKGISIYPNPTNGIIDINLAENNIYRISIMDMSGRKIIERISEAQNEKIDLSDYNNGLYIILIETDEKIFTSKIIME
jgi:Secretion system C-terminal sorting domain/HYR domain